MSSLEFSSADIDSVDEKQIIRVQSKIWRLLCNRKIIRITYVLAL